MHFNCGDDLPNFIDYSFLQLNAEFIMSLRKLSGGAFMGLLSFLSSSGVYFPSIFSKMQEQMDFVAPP